MTLQFIYFNGHAVITGNVQINKLCNTVVRWDDKTWYITRDHLYGQ